MEKNLTEGRIAKTMIMFAVPMMAGNFLQQIYNIADTVIVGRYIGSNALAAVGAAYTLMTFLSSVIIGLCMGCGAVFSIAYGAKDEKEFKESIWVSFWLIGTVTVMITVAAFFKTDSILRLLSVPEEIYGMMRSYIGIIFCGMVFVFLYNYFAYLLRSVGNSVIPLCFLAVSCVLNIILDLWFVIGLEKGVEGAAAATVAAQAVAGIGIMVYTALGMPSLMVEKQYRRATSPIVKKIVQYSFVTCLQQSVMNFGILMIQGLVNSFGTVIMAAFAAAVKIDTIAYMPAQEFGNAYSMFIAQNYGAKKRERIQKGTKTAVLLSVCFCICISLAVILAAPWLMKIFVDASETDIIAQGVRYLRIEGTFYWGIGCLFLLYGLYRGIAKPAMSLVLTVISLGTRVALAYIFAPQPAFGVAAIWWAIPIGWILADLTGFVYYKIKGKKHLVF